MSTQSLQSTDSGQAVFAAVAAADITDLPQAENVPAVATGGLVLLSDVITALGVLQASHNDLLAKLKASDQMAPDA